ncbi:MAG TPA: copper oxidase [Gemmataceae bacterium]|nr:copper oxidase [Gemmataceae bacterium]
MEPETTRREFLRGTTAATAGLLAAGAANDGRGAESAQQQTHDHDSRHSMSTCPRDHAGPGGPLGSATDRGKLVSGRRGAGLPPVLVETPDLAKLPWTMKDGVKEFHLIAKHTRREFLPNQWFDVWGFNDSVPGPTIEIVEGDRVRIIVHNELPESTTIHWHGLEVPNRMDGVHGLTMDPILPGKEFVYEFTLHQNGTFFYHSHGPMQEGIGMAGMLIVHPREAYFPPVDHDFALLIQEFAILPQSTIPNTTSMEFNWFTFNGRSGPYSTPLVVRLGDRVRIRWVNMSAIDHHPMHLHGHQFWITGTEAGRIPESAWLPANNVLVAVGQSRDVEFIANNPGDWMIHCHMFHHMMNHMAVMVGPMAHMGKGMPAGNNMPSAMGMTQSGPALAPENGPSLGRSMGEQTSNERTLPTGTHGAGAHAGHGMTQARSERVPGFPQDMMDMHGMMSEAEVKKINKPQTRGMRRDWYAGVEALQTVLRVLPPELYDQVMSGKGDIPTGASVPGAGASSMPGMHGGHSHGDMEKPKDSGKQAPPHDYQ